MKFGHCFVYQCVGDDFYSPGSGIEQTSGGDIVHLSGHTAGVVMDEILAFLLEDFFFAAGLGDAKVDIGSCLCL